MLNTRKIFLILAMASLLLSVSMWFFGDRQSAIYVGLWVPTILLLGQYKL